MRYSDKEIEFCVSFYDPKYVRINTLYFEKTYKAIV